MLSKTKLVKISQNFTHASQCKIKLSKPKYCKKCLAKDGRCKRGFRTHRGLFYHLVICHSDIDYDVNPCLKHCIQELVSECQQCQEENKD